MVQNCINCGAPIDTAHTKCPYCGTPYKYDGFNAEFENKNACGTLRVAGKEYQVYLGNVEFNGISSINDVYRDENGIMHRNLPTTKRRFTLIEV
nr:MAG TPA: LysW biosynthesis protein LysW [Bacteriophage sp.]